MSRDEVEFTGDMDGRSVKIFWRDTMSYSVECGVPEAKGFGYFDVTTEGTLIEESENTFKVAQQVWRDNDLVHCLHHVVVVPKLSIERVVLMCEVSEVWKNANL